jgi:L-amino acid N-acyltransferase YncA
MAIIRIAGPGDAPAIARIYRPAVTDNATSFELDPPDSAEMARRLEKTLSRTPWLVCEHHGEVLGYAYGGTHRERPAYRWTIEVSAYVRSDAHRSGIGKGLYTSLFEVLVLQGFRTAVAGITLPNPASLAPHESVGFNRIGVYHAIGHKSGRWHDVIWLERPLADYPPDPAPPVTLSEVMGSPEFQGALSAGIRCLKVS